MQTMIYLLTHGAALALLAGLVWLAGQVLGTRLLKENLDTFRTLGGIILGLGFWIGWAFVLATFGGLRPTAVAFTVAVLVAMFVAVERSRWQAKRAAWRWPTAPPFWTSAMMVAVVGILAPLAFLAMSPPVSWDASTYHLTLPRLYLEHGGFRPVEFNVYSHWPQNIELLFSLALLVMDYTLAKLVHFSFGLLTLYALFVGAREPQHASRTSGWLAAAFFLANGVVAFEMRVAYVDLAHAFFFLTAFLFLLRFRANPAANSGVLLLAGISCGLMAGVKVSGIAGVATLSVLLLPWLVVSWRKGELGKALSTCALHFVLPVAVLWFPWLVKSAIATGNPAYPLLYGVFGGPDWSLELGTRFTNWQQGMGMGREPFDYLLLPLRVILLGDRGYDHFDGSLGAFWLVLLPLAMFFIRRNTLVRQCLGVAGLYFVFWALTAQQMRFLLPLLPLLALATATAVEEVICRLRTARERWVAQVLALLLAFALVVGVNAPVLAAGYRTLARYAGPTEPLLESVVPPVFRFVNKELPANARILFLGTNQGFFCHRDYLADSFFEASQITDWLAPAQDLAAVSELLRQRGVSHVLVDRRPRGAEYPPMLWRFLADPGRAKQMYQSPDGQFLVLALL